MYNTNSYFYRDSHSNRKNMKENLGKKKQKERIDCDKSNKTHKKEKIL